MQRWRVGASWVVGAMVLIPSITGCSKTSKAIPPHVRWRVLNTTAPAIAVKETYAVIQRVEGWFAEPSERLDNWGDGEFAVVVHAMANALASKSVMTTQSGVVHGRYHATVHCLWEGSASGTTRWRWFQKNVAHEVASVYCDVLTRKKSVGWSFYSAPNWFVQGLPEWIGRSLFDPSWEGAQLPVNATKAETIDGFDEKGNIVPKNDYDGGAWLIERLVRVHGASALQRLLSEDALTFEDAFVRTFGASQRKLVSGL